MGGSAPLRALGRGWERDWGRCGGNGWSQARRRRWEWGQRLSPARSGEGEEAEAGVKSRCREEPFGDSGRWDLRRPDRQEPCLLRGADLPPPQAPRVAETGQRTQKRRWTGEHCRRF
ncbi:unnamed protein product [Caretta caretta]